MKKIALVVILLSFFAASCSAPTGMVKIEGGTFTMGSPQDEPNRGTDEGQHQVTVSGFYMGKHPVTQKEYQKIMGTNPSEFKGGRLPVENVNWYAAIAYCNKRSEKEGLIPAYVYATDGTKTNIGWNRNANGYRLPTEAEWEYACRAGTMTPFNIGDNMTTKQVNFDGNYPYNNSAAGEYREKTTPVGSFAPNAWGLHDMHGNVFEWCWDWYGSYSREAQTDPTGAVSGEYRVFRGGSWISYSQGTRSAFRGVFPPSQGNSSVGFRVVRNI